MIEQKIRYRKARDFGQIFAATFGYIKQNFKSFFGSIILFTVPFVALIAILGINIVSRAAAGGADWFNSWSVIESMALIFFLIFIFVLLVQTVYVTVINEHLIINEQLEENEKVKTSDIGKNFFNSFWRVLGNAILLGILSVIALIIYSIFNSMITMAFGTMGAGGIIFAALFQLLTSLLISPILAYVSIATLFAVQKEKVGVITALGYVFRYLKGNFWATWGVSFVGYMMTYICSIIVAIPMIIFAILAIVSRVNYTGEASSELGMGTIIAGAIIFVITVALFMCVYALYFLICSFQYTSLEEKKEGVSIIEKINQIQ